MKPYRLIHLRKKRISDALEALKLIDKGYTVRDAAKLLNTSHTRLYQCLNEIQWGETVKQSTDLDLLE